MKVLLLIVLIFSGCYLPELSRDIQVISNLLNLLQFGSSPESTTVSDSNPSDGQNSGSSPSLVGMDAFAFFDLGLANCFDNDSTEICPVVGFPGQASESTHSKTIYASYTDNVDETVTDNRTGLIWRQCPVGTFGTGCGLGAVNLYNFADAQTICSTTYGPSWRIPTIKELSTLLHFHSTLPPYVDQSFFPSMGTGTYYSSTSGGATYHFISFSQPSTNANTNFSSTRNVLCVSGTSTTNALDFVDMADGRIRDNTTGLEWQRCHSGLNNDATCSDSAIEPDLLNWQNALQYCSNLTFAGFSDWRLPNQNELLSLVDYSIPNPTKFDTLLFNAPTGLNNTRMWSSNVGRVVGDTQPFMVNPSFGILSPISAITGSYIARCIRGPN
ncbi:MAG: DUF1566 domain-containing protein [Leptospira sp.]|nr:DUF1566 domain-containing protein [Leptospira sp.]NCS93150.1 DUF1566 domain-containing protein [Leptospira sp.]